MFRGIERSAEIALRTEGVVIRQPEILSRSPKEPQVDLASFRSNQFDRGASALKEAMWLVVSLFLFRLCPFSLSALKCGVLRGFGARIGKKVVIKPGVKITFP